MSRYTCCNGPRSQDTCAFSGSRSLSFTNIVFFTETAHFSQRPVSPKELRTTSEKTRNISEVFPELTGLQINASLAIRKTASTGKRKGVMGPSQEVKQCIPRSQIRLALFRGAKRRRSGKAVSQILILFTVKSGLSHALGPRRKSNRRGTVCSCHVELRSITRTQRHGSTQRRAEETGASRAILHECPTRARASTRTRRARPNDLSHNSTHRHEYCKRRHLPGILKCDWIPSAFSFLQEETKISQPVQPNRTPITHPEGIMNAREQALPLPQTRGTFVFGSAEFPFVRFSS